MIKGKIEAENKIYDLSYSVSRLDGVGYAISVSKECDGNIVDTSTVKVMPITFESLVDIAEIMCRNTVTPTGFCEIVENMIIDRIVVE